MDYSNFIILLARQRSGTNALRSVLETHPDVFCLNEVFNLSDKDSEYQLQRETNFFTFIQKRCKRDIREQFADRHKTLFLDFLEYLRCFTSKRYILIDVKYNTAHLLTQPFLDSIASPYLFDLIIAQGLRVLNLGRKHYLRYILSVRKAWNSRRYFLSPTDETYSDKTLHIDPTYLMQALEKCHLEDQIVRNRFSSYENWHAFDYADLFPSPSGGVSNHCLESFSAWLGIPNSFRNEAQCKKQSSLTLPQTIANFEEISRALKGTRFEYCLEDEEIYQRCSIPAVDPAEIGEQ